MSGSVSLQSDVGSLGIQSLRASANILAILSADNVTPMAMIQMEELGATLPVNGRHAESVKGLLQRCNNVRLDRLALFVGWRKNDSASAMAQSAGGQAIALLSMCMTNLFAHDGTGTILSRLCSKLCASSANVSSMPRLADVATLLGSKVNALGFGNILACEVMRIQETYATLGYSSAPLGLLEPLNVEMVTDMLEKVSRALLHENEICRISGFYGMGFVVGMLQILFPCDTFLTIESVVMQDVEHPKIRCEITDSKHDKLIRVHVETSVSHTVPFNLPITQQNRPPEDYSFCHFLNSSFLWSGWLADCLRLAFTELGLILDRSILEACCDLLICIPSSIEMQSTAHPNFKLLALLGPQPRVRMCSMLEMVFGCRPTENHTDLQAAFAKLSATLDHAAGGLSCCCHNDPVQCEWSDIYQKDQVMNWTKKRSCPKGSLSNALIIVTNLGLLSLFIDPGPNATIRIPMQNRNYLAAAFDESLRLPIKASSLVLEILEMGQAILPDTIAASFGSSTVYPSILTSLQIPSHQLVTFSLVDGLLVHEQRYHTRLRAGRSENAQKARRLA